MKKLLLYLIPLAAILSISCSTQIPVVQEASVESIPPQKNEIPPDLPKYQFKQTDFGQVYAIEKWLSEYMEPPISSGHKILIAKTSDKAKHRFENLYTQQFSVEEALHGGNIEGNINAGYRMRLGKDPIPKDTRLILFGNWHKTGFNVIAIGSADDDNISALRKYLSSVNELRLQN